MKLLKQFFCLILNFYLGICLFLIPSNPVSAATVPSAPKNVDLYYYKNFPEVHDYAIPIQLGANGSGYIGVYAKKR